MTATSGMRRARMGAAAIITAILATMVMVTVNERPAWACSCLAVSDEEYFAGADAVFRGRFVGYEAPPPSEIMHSGDPATWTFAVQETYKGLVPANVEVLSAVSGASCGLEIPRQGEFYVFAHRPTSGDPARPGQYMAGLCGGTRSVQEGPLQVASIAGPPATTTIPAPATTVPPPAPTTTVPVATTVPVPTTVTPISPPSTTRADEGDLLEVAVVPIGDESGGSRTGTVALAVIALTALAAAIAAVRRFVRS